MKKSLLRNQNVSSNLKIKKPGFDSNLQQKMEEKTKKTKSSNFRQSTTISCKYKLIFRYIISKICI